MPCRYHSAVTVNCRRRIDTARCAQVRQAELCSSHARPHVRTLQMATSSCTRSSDGIVLPRLPLVPVAQLPGSGDGVFLAMFAPAPTAPSRACVIQQSYRVGQNMTAAVGACAGLGG